MVLFTSSGPAGEGFGGNQSMNDFPETAQIKRRITGISRFKRRTPTCGTIYFCPPLDVVHHSDVM
jgi:hypothetical protein